MRRTEMTADPGGAVAHSKRRQWSSERTESAGTTHCSTVRAAQATGDFCTSLHAC